MMLTASLLGAAAAGPSMSAASGDHNKHLHRQQHRLDSRIKGGRLDLDEISTRLVKAQEMVDQALANLASARKTLADVQDEVRAATRLDHELQDRLVEAVVRLDDARVDLRRGQHSVLDQREALASYAVSSYQTGGAAVFSLGVAFDSESPQDVLDTMQAADAVLDKQSVGLQQFEAAQVLLTLTEQRVQQTKEDVAHQRQAAADNLKRKLALQTQAQVAKQAVQDRLGTLRDAKREIAAAKQRERERLATLKKESDRVEHRLREIAKARARAHRLSQAAASRTASKKAGDGGYLSDPVPNSYITSPYGMRMHPILHVYKLHDGTDFHAPCGVPVYAAASGRVLTEYYNTGYGNRLFVDHGFVKGVSLQTSYNHLTSFVARPGQSVRRGQLLGYAGTTGYSTGCHLHFMVYVNGYAVDPTRWL